MSDPEDALPSYQRSVRLVNRFGGCLRGACYLVAIEELWRHDAWFSAAVLLGVYVGLGLVLGMLLGAYALGIRAAIKEKA